MFDIISTLQYFGITPDKITPLIILAIAGVIYINIVLNSKLNPIDKLLRKCSNAIIEIQTIFKQYGVNLDHKLTETSASPLKPTLYGVRLIKESGLEKILNENKQFFIDEVKKILPQNHTEYDVQEISRQTL